MDTKLQTNKMSIHCHYRSELSFRRKKDLRCTAHHNLLKFSSYVYVQQKNKKQIKKGQGVLPFYNRGRKNQQAQKTTKSDLVAAPIIHTHLNG